MQEVTTSWRAWPAKQRAADPNFRAAALAVRGKRGPICGEFGYITNRGLPCGKSQLRGGRPCNRHGSATPRGAASPNYVHGHARRRYNLPGKLGALYQQQAEDVNPLSLAEEIAVTRAEIALTQERRALLLEEPAEGEQRPALQRQMEKREAEKLLGHLNDLNARLDRQVATELKRIQQAQDTVRGEEVELFAHLVLDALRRRVLEVVTEADARVDGLLRYLEDGLRASGGVPGPLREQVEALRMGTRRGLRCVGDVQDDVVGAKLGVVRARRD